jgi:L,D-transpeptidase catalytic domain/Putative peptidoglycan binding domain
MRKSIFVLAGICSFLLITLGIWGFIDHQNEVRGFIPTNTTINGVDCSELTLEEVNRILSWKWNNQDFVVNTEDQHAGILTDIHFEYRIADSISDALIQSGMNPLLTWIAKEYHPFQADMQITKVNTEFTNQFNSLGFLNTDNKTLTTNAFIDMSTSTLPIVSEVYGNNIDSDQLLKEILSTIESGTFKLDIVESDFYVMPTVFSNDPNLLATQELYKNYIAFQITYDFGYNQEVLAPLDLVQLISYENGKVVIHENMVKEYIKKLAEKYNSAGMSRFFYSNGVKVSVYGGNYGYLIDQDAEILWLTEALKNGRSATRSPEYLPTERSHSNSLYGTTYVEIDLTKQHLWIYQNGNLVISTPVVTGNVAKETPTPPGSFRIFYMQRDRILRGDDWDGTKYETPVAYWMAFYRGVGLHDAPWRRSFGGTIYRANGSHGCVNMPPYMARAAYSLLYIGFPVIVHY